MSWLDPLLAIKTQQAGTTAGTRQTINFSSGATVTDDPANDRVNVAIAGGLPGVTVTGTPTAGQTVVASSASAAAWGSVPRGSVANTSGATGDLITGDATTLGRLGIGSTGQVLTVSGGAPVWATPGWFTAYEIDFTAQTPATYSANGTYIIGGQNWVMGGYDASSTFDLSAANGLRIIAAANTSNLPQWAGPSVGALGAASSDACMMWVRMEMVVSTSGGSFSYSGQSFSQSRVGATWSFYGSRTWQSGASLGGPAGEFFAHTSNQNGTTYPTGGLDYANYTTTNLSHDVWVWRWISPDRVDVWSGTWSGVWPSFSSLQYRGYVARNTQYISGAATLPAFNPADMKLGMSVLSGTGSSGQAIARLKAMRIQTR